MEGREEEGETSPSIFFFFSFSFSKNSGNWREGRERRGKEPYLNPMPVPMTAVPHGAAVG
jgi:hypothetical protein